MCGIAGIYAYSAAAPPVDIDSLLRSRDRMAARGPDGQGSWVSSDGRLGLAHRRLAIIDLGPGGAQPMSCDDGRYNVTFNGEIYNYFALRDALIREGIVFRSQSDTEVLLHLYRRDGAAMVDKLRGMFAFAIWDAQERKLFVARDPHGIKPLYYADDGATFRFASQVSALKAGGNTDLGIDPGGAVGFLLWGSVPEPFTLHRGIRQLPAGSTLTVTPAGLSKTERYWSIASVIRNSAHTANSIPRGSEVALLRAHLLDSVKAHLVSDVPVGAFLSAGLDSSTLVGLTRELLGAPLRTLTLSFDDFQGTDYDECPMAAEAARHIGTEHRCVVLPSAELGDELDAFLAAMDQPTIDGINTWLVCRAAKEAGLKVVLSGMGGDELLGGYATFRQVPELIHSAMHASRVWKRHPGLYRKLHTFMGSSFGWNPSHAGIPQHCMSAAGAYHIAKGVFMPWELPAVLDPDAVAAGLDALACEDAAQQEAISDLSPHAQIMCLESVRYMRNQLLRDSDWASMAHSLELRVPLIDSRLTSAIAGLASQKRLGKPHLPDTLRCALPESIKSRPKSGFTTPTWKWLRHHPGLDAWRSVPFLKQARVRDPRRWAYTLLHRTREAEQILLRP